MSYQLWNPLCAICRESVDLTVSKADEGGRAVHEECYVPMLLTKKNTSRFSVRIRPMHNLLQAMLRSIRR
jgi:hypothetical protein